MAPALFWVNKTARSASLSHSDDAERLELLSQAQRTSRQHKGKKTDEEKRFTSSKKDLITRFDDDGNVIWHTQLAERTLFNTKKELVERQIRKHKIKLLPCMDPDWTAEERRGVDFFLHATMFKIITLNRDAIFWKETVPRLTRMHPAFRHIVVAISSTHELLSYKSPDKLNVFAMKQCNKATRLLRSSAELGQDLLLASCILVSAYSLLRCDMVSADSSIESGLRMAAQPGGAFREDLKRMLFMLGRHNGYKLWGPDVNYQFEKSNLVNESFTIPEGIVNGPFVDTGQVLTAHRALTVEVATKLMRNLARGAYIDPDCAMSREISRQLGLFSFYFEHYSAQISPDDTDKRLTLVSISVNDTYVSEKDVTYFTSGPITQVVRSLFARDWIQRHF